MARKVCAVDEYMSFLMCSESIGLLLNIGYKPVMWSALNVKFVISIWFVTPLAV